MVDTTPSVSRIHHLPRLSIDSAVLYQRASLVSYSSFSSSTRASVATSFDSTSTDPGMSFFVSCLFDFSTDDPDQMPFRTGELLRIIKTEESGWWAAVRLNDVRVGWIPSSYVEVLQENECIALKEYSQQQRHDNLLERASAPPQVYRRPFDTLHEKTVSVFGQQWKRTWDEKPLPPRPDERDADEEAGDMISTSQEVVFYPPKLSKTYPPSPSIPLPPTPKTAPIHGEGSVNDNSMERRQANPPSFPGLNRADSCPVSTANSQARDWRRRPLLITDHASLSRLSVLIESPPRDTESVKDNVHHPSRMSYPDPTLFDGKVPPMPRPGKVKQITGDDEAETIYITKAAQASCPWFMKPIHGDDQIKVEFDGSVTVGTLGALVEKLTLEPLSVNVDREFRHAFLSTFTTLGTAEEIFDLLLEQYYLDAPAGITPSQLQEWKIKYLAPIQRRVLSIFTTWLEEHSMIEDDPPIARRLQNFLADITSSAENIFHAQKVMKTLERLTFAVPVALQQPVARTPKRRRTKDGRNELLRTDPATLAENLCLHEHALYTKIRPRECLEWVKIRTGESVANLATFIALHDKVASWVKQSVLWEENIGPRADLLEFWIKVAEKCRAMRNFTSTSAIVTALSSTVVQRLHLTWAYAKKASHLDLLTQLNDPAGSFAAYRQAQQATDTPCVPFIGMYLTDILHINDHYLDTSVKTGMSTDPTERLFNFVKRRKWSDTLDTILAHQKQRYPFSQDLTTYQLIEASLMRATEVVPNAFWAQSQDIQAAERQSSDIRGGLEAAGF